MWGRLGWLLAFAALGCSADEVGGAVCSDGERGCDGSRVLTCRGGVFEPTGQCGAGLECREGECRPPGFEFPGGDADTPGDTSPSPEDTWTDAGLPDAADPPTDVATIEDVMDVADPPLDVTPPEDAAPLEDVAPAEDVAPLEDLIPVEDVTDVVPGEDVTPVEDTGPPPVDPPGYLVYEAVPNIAVTGPIRRLAWDAAGDFALMTTGTTGQLAVYEPGAPGLAVGLTVDGSVADLAAGEAPGVLYAVGKDGDEAAVWRIERDGDVFSAMPDGPALLGDPVVILPESEDRWVIGTTAKSGAGYITRLTLWSETEGTLASKAWATGAGLTGAMLADLPMFAGSLAVMTSEGWNGADSSTWIVSTDLVVDNGWKVSFGNPGRGAWRPGGAFGMFAATSTKGVYVYDGAWQKTSTQLAGNSGGMVHDIAWTADGTRALAVARPTGSSLAAPVTELRPTSSSYNPNQWVDQSIQNFGDAPWYGDFNHTLLAVAWRPQSACAEGLIGVNRSSGTLSLLIRYVDSDDPDCP